MVALLHSRNALPDSTLHGYHCDCPSCSFDSDYDLRAQRDSSCSGEIITRPFNNMDEARPVMLALQEAAIDADAEPGWNSGMHVHVFVGGIGHPSRANLFWQFLEWEPVLSNIAAGRFSEVRANNTTLTNMHRYMLLDYDTSISRYDDRANIPNLARTMRVNDNSSFADCRQRTYTNQRDADRHTNLNVRTRYDTWEFRLWNSTRSAWRMELWCWLSLALADTGLNIRLSEATITDEPSVELLQNTMFDHGYAEAAVLLDRQRRYMETRAVSVDDIEIPFTVAV